MASAIHARRGLLLGLGFVAAVVLAVAVVSLKHGEWAFAPDGSFWWQHPDQWFANSNCDVWSDVRPRKPIDAFEIEYRNARVRLCPDRTAAIILEKAWNDDLGYFGNGSGPVQVKSEDALKAAGYQIIAGKVPTTLANEATSLVAPMGDFAGWVPDGKSLEQYLLPGVEGAARKQLRNYFDLDDERTRVAACPHRVYDAGYGWTILHWNHKTGEFGGASSFFDIGCYSPAAVAGQGRAARAAALLVKALGANEAVSRHDAEVSDPILP